MKKLFVTLAALMATVSLSAQDLSALFNEEHRLIRTRISQARQPNSRRSSLKTVKEPKR